MGTLTAALLAGALLGVPARAQVRDGDFELARSPAWHRVGKGLTVRRVAPPGWQQSASRFSSGEYSRLRLYLRIQSGTGSVWFDEAFIAGLSLSNFGFEEAGNNKIAGWEQDNVGQTIFSSTEDPFAGERSLLLRQEKDGVSRVWQEAACRPNTEYEAGVAMRAESFRGAAYAEIYGVRENGELGQIIWTSDIVSGSFKEQLGQAVLELQTRGEATGGLAQDIRWPAGRNLYLSADFAAPRMSQGRVTVSVWSGARMVAEVGLDEPQGHWVRRLTLFQSPAEQEAVVRVTASGRDMLAYVDNVSVTEPVGVIPATRAQFVEAARNLVLGKRLAVRLSDPSSDLLRKGVAILARRVSTTTAGAVALEYGEGRPALEVTVAPPSGPKPAWPASESYVLACSESGVRVKAPTEQGACYGMMAVGQLLSRTPDRAWQLIAARVEDAPQLPLRATYMAGLPRHRAARLVWCERFAELRLNAVVFEDDVWWRLDNEADRRAAEEAFADFRAYGLEPIPELQSFGWAHLVLAIDPMAAEGTWVEREPVALRGEEPVRLRYPNVLRTESTDITVADAQGAAYQADRDYEVVNGVTRYPYRVDAAPYVLRRRAGGRIADGATVYVSYDYVSRVNSDNCPYCPSEPRVAGIMTAAMRNTVRHLRPKYVHIGHDEPAQMNTDSRCLRRHLTNGELLAEDVRRLRDAAREVDPQVRLMMWADAVNPYHNGFQFAQDPTARAIDLLPKDVIQCVWFYGANQPLKEGADSLRFFAAHGLATTGSPWNDEACATRWGQACLGSRLRGEECLGVIYTSWGDRWEALEACAKSAWRPPTAEKAASAKG